MQVVIKPPIFGHRIEADTPAGRLSGKVVGYELRRRREGSRPMLWLCMAPDASQPSDDWAVGKSDRRLGIIDKGGM